MFTPKFTLTSALLTEITQIERLYGQIEALRLPHELELNLERTNLVQSAYASNKIEGNPLTLPEVTNLLLDDRVPTNRNEKEVVNYFALLKELDGFKEKPINLMLLKEFHKRLMTGVHEQAGHIRNVKVVIGKYNEEKGDVSIRIKHDPPYHTETEIETHMEELLAWLRLEKTSNLPAVIRAGAFHHEFVYLHPFEDGNGRVCRLLTALLFVKAGYAINKYFVLDDYYDIDRHQYSDMLHAADTGDKTTWLVYFSQGVKYSLQSALARAKQAILTLKVKKQPTPKEREVLSLLIERQEITSHTIAEALHVSRQQAHSLLKSLVEKGLVRKKGSTKASYYILRA